MGQEGRMIKAIPPEDIEALQQGSGTALRGLAKPAELNGIPGPKHVLDASEELNLSEEQKKKINSIYKRMHQDAVQTGKRMITAEKEIDNFFSQGNMDEEKLEALLNKSAEIYEKLRYVHLKAHLETSEVLTSHQIRRYNQVRGYSGDPCEEIPEGHDPEMWKKHNGCQ